MNGVIRYHGNGNPICEICGKNFSRLLLHVYRIHHITKRDYKTEFGLKQKKGICSVNSSLKTKESNKKYLDELTINLNSYNIKYRYQKGSKGRVKELMSEQERIEITGRCKAMHDIYMIRHSKKQVEIIAEPISQISVKEAIKEEIVKSPYKRKDHGEIEPMKSLADRIVELDNKLLLSCTMICGNRNDAHDLKQETIYTALTTEYDERNQLFSWLYGIAKNLHYQKLRGIKIGKVEYVEEYKDEIIEDVVVEAEPIRKVNKGTNYYVDQLSDKDKRIFKMRYIKISYKNIAEKMNLNEEYVKSRYWIIRKELKEMIENDCN